VKITKTITALIKVGGEAHMTDFLKNGTIYANTSPKVCDSQTFIKNHLPHLSYPFNLPASLTFIKMR
jgi:hypothetical protein